MNILVARFFLFSCVLTAAFANRYEVGDNYLLEWGVVNTNIEFKVTAKSSGWVGLGFNDDPTPSEAEILIFGVSGPLPTAPPTPTPSVAPTTAPTTPTPSVAPTTAPTTPTPSVAPTTAPPTDAPSTAPPTDAPSTAPPTDAPSTASPTDDPSTAPPTDDPSTAPPTDAPSTASPTDDPSTAPPTDDPSTAPPTDDPSTAPPTDDPSTAPSATSMSNKLALETEQYLKVYRDGREVPSPLWKIVSAEEVIDGSNIVTTIVTLSRPIRTPDDDDFEFDEIDDDRFINILSSTGSTDDIPSNINSIQWRIGMIDLYPGLSSATLSFPSPLNMIIALLCSFYFVR